MKIFKAVFLIALVGFFALPLVAEKKKADPEKSDATETAGPFDGIANFKYSSEQIANLKKLAEYRKAKYSFSGGFYTIPMPNTAKKRESLKKKHEKKGTTPFRICASVYETKEIRGIKKKSAYYRKGADIYIIDMEKKKIVKTKRVSLKKLCAS